jgi:hypothetical protein
LRSVRPEIAPAGVQTFDPAGVANDLPIPVERQHPIGTAVQEQQAIFLVDTKAARIGLQAIQVVHTESDGELLARIIHEAGGLAA